MGMQAIGANPIRGATGATLMATPTSQKGYMEFSGRKVKWAQEETILVGLRESVVDSMSVLAKEHDENGSSAM